MGEVFSRKLIAHIATTSLKLVLQIQSITFNNQTVMNKENNNIPVKQEGKENQVFAIINFEAQEASDTIVKAFWNEDQARKELEEMEAGTHTEHGIYAGDIVPFYVLGIKHTPQNPIDVSKGETVESFMTRANLLADNYTNINYNRDVWVGFQKGYLTGIDEYEKFSRKFSKDAHAFLKKHPGRWFGRNKIIGLLSLFGEICSQWQSSQQTAELDEAKELINRLEITIGAQNNPADENSISDKLIDDLSAKVSEQSTAIETLQQLVLDKQETIGALTKEVERLKAHIQSVYDKVGLIMRALGDEKRNFHKEIYEEMEQMKLLQQFIKS